MTLTTSVIKRCKKISELISKRGVPSSATLSTELVETFIVSNHFRKSQSICHFCYLVIIINHKDPWWFNCFFRDVWPWTLYFDLFNWQRWCVLALLFWSSSFRFEFSFLLMMMCPCLSDRVIIRCFLLLSLSSWRQSLHFCFWISNTWNIFDSLTRSKRASFEDVRRVKIEASESWSITMAIRMSNEAAGWLFKI